MYFSGLAQTILVLFSFVVLGLVCSVLRQELGLQNVSEMTCFVSSGTLNLNLVNPSLVRLCVFVFFLFLCLTVYCMHVWYCNMVRWTSGPGGIEA